MTEKRSLEDRLRDELRRRADTAPSDASLSEHIIRTAVSQPAEPGHRRFGWTMPLLAAAAVAAIVTGVFVAVAQLRNASSDNETALGNSRTPTASSFSSTASPSVEASSATPSAQRSLSPTTSRSSGSTLVDNGVGIANFALTDITFYGTDDAWAIGTADCLDGSAGPCKAMVVTTDGGASWKSTTPPGIDATGIRFATPQVGYAYNDESLEMTTDGGQTWQLQKGGAVALESLDNNVIRVTASQLGCPGPCDIGVQYAKVGSSDWTTAKFPAPVDASELHLVRSDSDAYVLIQQNPAGGGDNEEATLVASTDDGATWTDRGEPCETAVDAATPEIDSWSVAAAPDDAVVTLCSVRGGDKRFLAVSSDAGAHFGQAAGALPAGASQYLTGDPSTVLVAAGNGAYRSTDGGDSWKRIREISGAVSFVGFESPTLGRIVTNGGRTIWTTTDAGTSWTSYTFPS